MKTINLMLILVLTAIVSSSCVISNGYVVSDDYDTTNFVVRTYDLKDFNAIECNGVAHVEYKQGNTYSVTARSTQEMLDKTKITCSSNKLVIDQKSLKMKNQSPVFIEISSPDLNKVDISGVSTFKTSSIVTTGKFDIDMSGVGNIEFDSIRCSNCGIDVSGAGKFYGLINATDKVEVDAGGAVKSEIDINANELVLDCSGAVKMTVGFSGRKADVDCSGVSQINISVDCEELKAENSGVSSLTIKGVAENTNILSSGVSTIDTKELNKF